MTFKLGIIPLPKLCRSIAETRSPLSSSRRVLIVSTMRRIHVYAYAYVLCEPFLSLPLSFILVTHLRATVAPVCKMKEVTIIGASLEESVKVRCEVEADPSVVDFVWEFNNSGENFEVAPAKFDGNNGTMSELVYTPESERDYGALTCWGRNEIGKQEAPCIYQVIPAGDDISDNFLNGSYFYLDKWLPRRIFFQAVCGEESCLCTVGIWRYPRIIGNSCWFC